MRTKREQYIFYDQALAQRDVSKPTIAMVRGHCIAGGLLNACMCDIIYASENASFGNPVARMTPAGAEVFVEPWEMGVRRAKEFLWTGEPVDAQEAWRVGLVNKVVPDDKLEEEVLNLARKIALTPVETVSLLKRSLNRTLDFMGQRDSWEYHFLIHQMSHSTDEAARFGQQVRGPARETGGLKAFLKVRDEGYEK